MRAVGCFAGADWRLADFADSDLLSRFRSGEPAVVRDAALETVGASGRRIYERSGVRATISIPLVVNGLFRAVLYASEADSRDWTEAEIQVTRDVAERTWATVERARAEQRLGGTGGRSARSGSARGR